jgi:hypothetical protein
MTYRPDQYELEGQSLWWWGWLSSVRELFTRPQSILQRYLEDDAANIEVCWDPIYEIQKTSGRRAIFLESRKVKSRRKTAVEL